jgi:hypothetical protein
MPFDTECQSRRRGDCDAWLAPQPANLAPWNVSYRLHTQRNQVHAPWPWDLARVEQESLLPFRGKRYELSNGDSVSLFKLPRARATRGAQPSRDPCCVWPNNATWVVQCDAAACSSEATADYAQPQILMLRTAHPRRLVPIPNNTWVEVLRKPSARESSETGCALAAGRTCLRPA